MAHRQMRLRAGRKQHHRATSCTVTSRACSLPPGPYLARHRNSVAAAIPCRRAICETVT
jgi:hypothetical protein